jgi:Flp pilus assembly protein TadB
METLFEHTFNAGVLVPLGAFAVAIVAIVSGAMSQAQARRVKAEQRLAMLQRGMTAEQIATILKPADDEEAVNSTKTKDPLRSLANARRAATILVSVGAGMILFGLSLTIIQRDREVLIVAATGLIPLALSIGFFVDYRLQQRELARFGLEVGAELPPENHTR